MPTGLIRLSRRNQLHGFQERIRNVFVSLLLVKNYKEKNNSIYNILIFGNKKVILVQFNFDYCIIRFFL